jgi:hypothetical protein
MRDSRHDSRDSRNIAVMADSRQVRRGSARGGKIDVWTIGSLVAVVLAVGTEPDEAILTRRRPTAASADLLDVDQSSS